MKDEEGLLKFAKRYNLKLDFYAKDKLPEMLLSSGFSPFVRGRVGVGGVCKPAALKPLSDFKTSWEIIKKRLQMA